MREIVNSLELYFYFDESDACVRKYTRRLPSAGVYFLFSTNGVAAKPGVLHEKSNYLTLYFLYYLKKAVQ